MRIRIRLILLVMAVLAFVSAAAGGFVYYSSLRRTAVENAERQAAERLTMIGRNISVFLSENIRPAGTLAAMEELRQALLRPDEKASLGRANAVLDLFTENLGVEVCYLMDSRGNTIASSNREDPDSFVGENFAFRSYFRQAMGGTPVIYMGLGTTSHKRGVYYGHPVRGPGGSAPLGIAVIKKSIELIEQELITSEDEVVLVADPRGIIFVSSRGDWLFRAVSPLSPADISRVADSRQFGDGPWQWTGLTLNGIDAVTESGERYMVRQGDVDNFPGWRIIYLRGSRAVARMVADPLVSSAGHVIVALCLLVGASVFLLYRKAGREIAHRKAAETALQKSEERYRSIYHSAPAMIHSIDSDARLVMVSNHWLETLGYTREEVIGRKITDFLGEASRVYAETEVLPEFFRTGNSRDIYYQFLKKNGEPVTMLLSAIGVRDEKGEIAGSLTVSIDATEQKRAEAALKEAQEELAHYARDLERQVRKRTREITSIFRYTPAVVFLKDAEGRYVLVNPRFEELFGIGRDEVKGKTDHDLFPRSVADQLQENDARVLAEDRSFQVEEKIYQAGSPRTYLSVKFPLYDEFGGISGLCGISTDITAIKSVQEQLKRLSGSIMAGQEKERAVIARELHDELGQSLTALHMDCKWMHARMEERDPKAASRALSMCGLIDKTIEEVRGLAVRLRPGVLDRLGLVDALEWYTSDFEKRTGITCIFDRDEVPAIDDAVATAAYRIAQEALTNVARHSRATCVNVVLQGSGGVLDLSITDNGRGFNADAPLEAGGLGVLGMRERAFLVGGGLVVESAAGKGTRVQLKVNIND